MLTNIENNASMIEAFFLLKKRGKSLTSLFFLRFILFWYTFDWFLKIGFHLLFTIIIGKTMGLISQLDKEFIALIVNQRIFVNFSKIPYIKCLSYKRIRFFAFLSNMGCWSRFSLSQRCKLDLRSQFLKMRIFLH